MLYPKSFHLYIIETNLGLKNLQKICSIPFRSKLCPSYFHSFGMTENYIIFVEQPLKLDIFRLTTAYFRGVTWGKCLTYDQDDVVSKADSYITIFFSITEPLFRSVYSYHYLMI